MKILQIRIEGMTAQDDEDTDDDEDDVSTDALQAELEATTAQLKAEDKKLVPLTINLAAFERHWPEVAVLFSKIVL